MIHSCMTCLFRAGTVFLAFLRLGVTSFGGPVAHIGYFRDEFVTRRQWLSERSYADVVALCQFLPGPASSQTGMAIGLSLAGFAGALAAWVGFTLPSAILLVLFALGVGAWGDALPAGLLHGLKLVAVAVVTQAVWGMGRTFCADRPRIAIAALACSAMLLVPAAWIQVAVIVLAGLAGVLLFRPAAQDAHDPLPMSVSRPVAAILLAAFFVLLFGLPLLEQVFPGQPLAMLSAFYRAGSLVFGGGHVVLPLLHAEVVPRGWVSNDTFLAGYGAAQAVPGPLFTFAAFLGAAAGAPPNGWAGGLLCLVGIFLPSFFLVVGALPFWEQLRRSLKTRAALSGINAAVVGLLLAALYQPVWVSAVRTSPDFCLVLAALVLLIAWKLPPWLVVLLSGAAGWIML